MCSSRNTLGSAQNSSAFTDKGKRFTSPPSLPYPCSRTNWFAHIDLLDAYLMSQVDVESSKLLTINAHRGLFKFNRLFLEETFQ